MADADLLPEFARSLRGCGRPGGAVSLRVQQALFEPLLETRRRAIGGERDSLVAAMRGRTLLSAIESNLAEVIGEGVQDAAVRRARQAELEELLEPLARAAERVDAGAAEIGSDAGWQHWVSALRALHTAADDLCEPLTRLAESPAPAARRPFRPLGR